VIPHAICHGCLDQIPADSDLRQLVDEEIVSGDQPCCWCGEVAQDGLFVHAPDKPPKCSCP
jgi:hypothetical protein